MPLQATSGAATYDAFGRGVVAPPTSNYIEDVFNTWIYTGNGTSQTITNDINLSGKGGLVWLKSRSAGTNHFLFDTTRGALSEVNSNTTDAPASLANSLTAFNSNGFSLGSDAGVNTNLATYVSWTFEKQAKFFDMVTYTGTGANRTVAHNLGSVPGCIMVKRTDVAGGWQVYHQSLTATNVLLLNGTGVPVTTPTRWNDTSPTSTVFTVGTDVTVNASGGTYMAYLFAHNAGGFGPSNLDNVISCGSYVGNGSAAGGPTITLGYEPQFVIIKRGVGGTGAWQMFDNMRGMPVNFADSTVQANALTAESDVEYMSPTATGFRITSASTEVNASTNTYVYIAIRRGPMKPPDTGLSVFSAKTYNATTTSASVTHDVTFDAEINANRPKFGGAKFLAVDSLRGINGRSVWTASNGVEGNFPTYWSRNGQRGMRAVSSFDSYWASDAGTQSHVSYGLVRAPGFFDIVCYTGNGVARTLQHGLSATPELMLVKSRNSGTGIWVVYSSFTGAAQFFQLNSTATPTALATMWDLTAPTSSVFTVGTNSNVNGSGLTYLAYLFASRPGVSKVGTYTGTGTASSQVVDCGFTGGVRFVFIKSTTINGNWFVWDSARGIVAGNDPYLVLNATDVEVTTTDWVNTAASGFEVSNASGNLVNNLSATYIYFAIA